MLPDFCAYREDRPSDFYLAGKLNAGIWRSGDPHWLRGCRLQVLLLSQCWATVRLAAPLLSPAPLPPFPPAHQPDVASFTCYVSATVAGSMERHIPWPEI